MEYTKSDILSLIRKCIEESSKIKTDSEYVISRLNSIKTNAESTYNYVESIPDEEMESAYLNGLYNYYKGVEQDLAYWKQVCSVPDESTINKTMVLDVINKALDLAKKAICQTKVGSNEDIFLTRAITECEIGQNSVKSLRDNDTKELLEYFNKYTNYYKNIEEAASLIKQNQNEFYWTKWDFIYWTTLLFALTFKLSFSFGYYVIPMIDRILNDRHDRPTYEQNVGESAKPTLSYDETGDLVLTAPEGYGIVTGANGKVMCQKLTDDMNYGATLAFEDSFTFEDTGKSR